MSTPGLYTTTTSGQFTTAADTVMLPTVTSSVATASDHYDHHLQTIATSMTALAINSSVVTPGMISIRNTDQTNYVEVGLSVSGTFTPLFKMNPGDPPCQMRYDGVAIQLKANTAACDVSVFVSEA